MKKTLIVNLFGAPGAGKSTGAAYIFAKIKMAGIDAELITEYAKDKVWEENKEVFNNQLYMVGKQSFRISRCVGKVDVIITDSPLPLSIFYKSGSAYTENFDKCVMDVFNSYYNLNYMLERVKKYNPNGRFQTEEESDKIAKQLVAFVNEQNIDCRVVPGCENGYERIANDIIALFKE